jgi:hypothetical protein
MGTGRETFRGAQFLRKKAGAGAGVGQEFIPLLPAPSNPVPGGKARAYEALAVVPVRMSALRLRAAINPSMPSFFRMAANSERRVATSLIAPSR